MDKLITFKNGLRLVEKKIDGMLSTTIGVWVGTGSVDENSDNNGISHYIEHMLFKGTEKRSAFDIVAEIDGIGASINAFTSKECTCYYTKCTAEQQEKSFEILSDLFFNSKFDEEEMEREKKVVLEEISMCEDTPDDKCLELLAQAYFADYPLGKPIIGTPKNVENFSKADIKAYMDKHYVPSNVVIAVCGAVEFDKIEKFVEKYFVNNFTVSSEPSERNFDDFVPNCGFLSCDKDIEQAHFAIAFPSAELGSERLDALQILNNVLGGGMSSRLFQNVREKHGLAYTVYSYLSAYRKTGSVTIYAGINPNKLELAVRTIREVLDEMVENGITQEEFSRGREQLKGGLILAQESTSSIMSAYGKIVTLTGKMINIEERLERISKITLEDINSMIPSVYDFDKVSASFVGRKKYCKNVLDIFQKKN